MFKKLRKLYFKIYHLFKLLGIFILVFGIKRNVYAEECDILWEQEGKDIWIDGQYFYASKDATNLGKVNPIANESYTFFILNSDNTVFNMNGLGFARLTFLNSAFYDNTNGYYKESITTSTTSSDIIPFYFWARSTEGANYQPYINIKDKKIYIVKGTEICIPQEEPPGPVQDEVYSSFLEIYKDRLIYLTEGFTTNPYLIAMIGIIISFIVLELLLKIINIGRNRRR